MNAEKMIEGLNVKENLIRAQIEKDAEALVDNAHYEKQPVALMLANLHRLQKNIVALEGVLETTSLLKSMNDNVASAGCSTAFMEDLDNE